jgi:hypothetical protein
MMDLAKNPVCTCSNKRIVGHEEEIDLGEIMLAVLLIGVNEMGHLFKSKILDRIHVRLLQL